MNPVQLSVVIPCFNEEDVLPRTILEINSLLQGLKQKGLVNESSSIWLIDDGSQDNTWSLISGAVSSYSVGRFHGIKLSRNCGHQNALLAGLMATDGDVAVSIDADLQDDLGAIEKMIEEYYAGAEIVYGVRVKRDSDTLFKRFTARSYYKLLQNIGAEVVDDHADFRLMSRKALEALRQFEEANLFLRGIIPLLGFKTAVVGYERMSRLAGQSKYPLRRMLGLALQGITSFSIAPLRIITAVGLGIAGISFLAGLWVIWVKILTQATIPGWSSTILPIFFLGGVQLLSLGVLGEYVGRIYLETKRRPRFFVEQRI